MKFFDSLRAALRLFLLLRNLNLTVRTFGGNCGIMEKNQGGDCMKRKKTWILTGLLVLVAAALLLLLAAKPLYHLYRDISFYWGERTEAEWAVKTFADQQGISYGEYPQSLIDLYGRNPETENFVLNYPFRQSQEVALSAFDRETVPLFLQWDPLWGYEKYGSSYLAITGCGPTCLAMVGYYLTGDAAFSPDQVAAFAEKNGYYQSGYGSSWKLISQGSQKLGLTATELPLVKKKMVTALEEGCPIILAMGPGDFTTTGHYIVLTGVTDDGFTVNDPNSRENSGRLWRYEELEGQIRNIWKLEKA